MKWLMTLWKSKAFKSFHTWKIRWLSLLELICFSLYDLINLLLKLAVQFKMFQWTDLCKAYLQEAKWYHSGYVPTLQEYLDNAWISISAPVILVHAYFFVSNPITNEGLECLDRYHNIIRCSAMILRLADDLGTSTVSCRIQFQKLQFQELFKLS